MSSNNYNSSNSTNIASHNNLRHPYVRPTSLRSEYYDDVPKIWLNGKGTNNLEIESLIGGEPLSLTWPEYISSIWFAIRHQVNITQHIFIGVMAKWIASLGQNKTRCYILLLLSIIAECYSTALSKQAKEAGSTRIFLWSCLVNFFCLVGFNISLAQIEVSVAYAIWSAMGTCLVTVVGILVFNESYDLMKIICLGLITAGVVGLNLRDDGEHH